MTTPYPSYKESGAEWMARVPTSWQVLSGRRVFSTVREPASTDDQQLSATQRYGVVPQSYFMEQQDQKVTLALGGLSGFRHVEIGDFVISLRSFQGGIEYSAYTGCVSPAYTVLRRRLPIADRYFYYLMKSDPYISALQASTEGIRDGKTISYDQFATISLPYPDLSEQTSIAVFLDRETGKIDTLVEEQKRLIELLKEKRQAVIFQAVTKGLDPDARMKASGIEWLGEVPAHWEIARLKHLVAPETSITYGIVQAGPHFEGGVPYIRTGDMAGNSLPTTGYPLTSPEIDSAYQRSKVFAGDLVIAIRATVGKCLPVPKELDGANLTQGTAKISPGNRTDRDFLLFAISCSGSQVYFDLMSKGATFREITLDALRRLPIAIPPVQEQKEVADFISCQTAQIDALVSEVEKAIVILIERRAALISAAVTGKIDVRDLIDKEAA